MTDIALEAALDRFEKAAFEKFANLPRGKAERAEVVASREAEYNSSREAIRTYLRAFPSQVAPANPAQVTDALKSAEKALRPYYNAVFNDNGDIEVDGPYDYDEAVAGYFAYKKIERAIAAIGAGGQAVAEDATISEMVRAYNRTTDYIFPQATDKEQREAMRAVYATLFQPHLADERVVEAAITVLKWLDGGCSSWSVPQQQIRILALSVKEGR